MSLLNNLFGSGAQNAAQGLQGTTGLQGAIGPAQQSLNQLGQAMWTNTTVGNAHMAQQQYNNVLSQAAGQHTIGKITGETHTPATSKELEHEAYNVSVGSLIDLWVTRYGNEWIDLVDVEGDNFFRLAYRRLKQMGELETHYLTDRARYVCRRPE
jgi:hypothetical protein